MSEASQVSQKAGQLSVIGVPLQAGTLVTLVIAVLLGKNSFESQGEATKNVEKELYTLQRSVSEFQLELRTDKATISTLQESISTLKAEREKLDARVHLLEECIRSKARCRL